MVVLLVWVSLRIESDREKLNKKRKKDIKSNDMYTSNLIVEHGLMNYHQIKSISFFNNRLLPQK